jgi:hypothetical protein
MNKIWTLLAAALMNGARNLAAGVLGFLILALLCTLLSACSEDESSINQQVRAYEKKLQSKIAEIEDAIEVLKTRIDFAGRELRVEWFQEIDELEQQRKTLHLKLQELQSASAENLQQQKASIDLLLQDSKKRNENFVLIKK